MEATERIGPTLGQRMLARRRHLGISMKRLAQNLGVCEKTICNWEHDESCFPVDKLIPACHALHMTPRQLLGIESDLDAAVKLQEVREVCQAIGQITWRLRNIPDLVEASKCLVERDRLRNQLRELLDLPPLEGDNSAEFKRTEQWHHRPDSGGYRKNGLIMRYIDGFRATWVQPSCGTT